jgi:hypothetical protein
MVMTKLEELKAWLRDKSKPQPYLRYADLYGAGLRGADLREANLYVADLRGADLRGAKLPHFQIQQNSRIVVWKAVTGAIAKLSIPAKAKRTASLIGRKCRADRAKVLGFYDKTGKKLPLQQAESKHSSEFLYTVKAYVEEPAYDDNPAVECTTGIHFFLTFEEAVEWL